jgi:molybdenum cofactor cytidylyltransferase
MNIKNPRISVILLAAGKSERMGRNKLLMPFEGGTVIGRTLDNLQASRAGEIVVVLGARAQEMGAAIGNRPVSLVLNPNYTRGMSTSLITGLQMVSKQAKYALVALGDQPFVTPQTYDKLIDAALNTEKGILVPVYQKQRGNPILIHAGYFPEIMHFSGDVGGRELLTQYPDDLLEVKVADEGVIINVNTPDEYEKRIGKIR